MTRNRDRRGRFAAEESDDEDPGTSMPAPRPNVTLPQDNHDQARVVSLQNLQAIDLGTNRRDFLTASDKPPRGEDRVDVGKLLRDRYVNIPGTEEHGLYQKNKTAINAWSNPANVVNNHEEDNDPLDNGNAHRQRLRNNYGGRIEEPNDYEAGYAARPRGGFRGNTRGGRGGGAVGRGVRTHVPPPVPAPTLLRETGRQVSRPPPAQSTNSRPLDPAIDTSDPRSKYRNRGGAPGGFGRGNMGLSAVRVAPVGRAAPYMVPATTRPTRPPGPVINMLDDPTLFLRAVAAMSKTSQKNIIDLTSNSPKPLPKASSTTIKSKWGDPAPAKPAPASKHPVASSLPGPSPITKANIRQVPTHEFTFPPPHRGDTDSWTDGVESAHPSIMDSPSRSQPSQPAGPPPAPAIGLGITGLDTAMEEDDTTNSGNTADVVDLMDVTEDLSALDEAPLSRVPLAERIQVNGAWYILDKSALGNAVPQPETASPTPNTVTEPQPKNMVTNTPSKISSRNFESANGTQTTPSLTSSRWSGAPPKSVVPTVDNPFASSTAIPRAPAQSSASITSTPSISSNLAASRWGGPTRQVNTGASVRTTTNNQVVCDHDAFLVDAADSTQSRRIDNFDLVRLQQVGNASFGMTPFGAGLPPPPATTMATHERQQSTAVSVTSESNASTRNLAASEYTAPTGTAPASRQTLPALSSLSLNTKVALRGNGDNLHRPSRSVFSTGNDVSCFASNENVRPGSGRTTPIISTRQRVEPTSTAIRDRRTAPGPGFAILQADIAAAQTASLAPPSLKQALTQAFTESAGLFPTSAATTRPQTGTDSSESEL